MNSHYNPLANPRSVPTYGVKFPGGPGSELSLKREYLPRFCMRQISFYKRCLVANEEDSEKCQREQDDIISICPSFALDILKDQKLQLLKREAINNKIYRESMQVPSYNTGRTVANVPWKTWADGTSTHLRPDTMWADERYADVTQKEVDAAKERMRKRRSSTESKGLNPIQPYDRTYAQPPK